MNINLRQLHSFQDKRHQQVLNFPYLSVSKAVVPQCSHTQEPIGVGPWNQHLTTSPCDFDALFTHLILGNRTLGQICFLGKIWFWKILNLGNGKKKSFKFEYCIFLSLKSTIHFFKVRFQFDAVFLIMLVPLFLLSVLSLY